MRNPLLKWITIICVVLILTLLYVVCKPKIDERVIKESIKHRLGDKLVFELVDLQMKYEDFMMTDFDREYIFSCKQQMKFFSSEEYDDSLLLKQGWIKTRCDDWEQIRHFSDHIIGVICYEALLTKDDNYFLCFDFNDEKYAVSYEEANIMLNIDYKDYFLAVYSPKNNLCVFIIST